MISRPYQFLLFFVLAFFNPITLWWIGTSQTFIAVVPCTLMIWFVARWNEIVKINEKSNVPEVLFGLGIYALDIAYNIHRYRVMGVPRGEAEVGFGLIDMLATFISVCIAFYGLKGLRHFTLPTAYLSILIVGYQLEFAITEVAFLENLLAHLITSILNLLTITASANGNLVAVQAINGAVFSLVIDAPCTGIKGMLAYGSLATLMILDVQTTYKRKALCTTIGLIGTFLVNILRLLTIFLACYFFGIEAALAVHTYLGYGLFIVWVLTFWIIAFRYLVTPRKARHD